ncbi:hypothetical protein GPECTOR_1g205 [Gonium pectorale]|uniref:Uncharacterized protein n=1 Tax=Gonium pectorale TaxID=33097 RepID=A0A150H254_GONPE|nr:hypothetical protein GPECTOR_1g205 [Gonium pectorale]|eukprot:KXZ56236.1 hypothetical protein GPECTOR_1g205 [Gonium pectorale]
MSFLQSTLETMELAAGGELSVERAKLQELQRALGGLDAAKSRPAETTDELVLASELDKLEEQLAAVEQQIATADNGTKQLLTAAVSTTMRAAGDLQAAGPSAPGPSTSSSSSAAASDGAAHSSSSANPSAASGPGVSGPLATGLLPVAEQEADEQAEVLGQGTAPES